MSTQKQIFLDETKRRWKVAVFFILTASIGLGLLFTTFLKSLNMPMAGGISSEAQRLIFGMHDTRLSRYQAFRQSKHYLRYVNTLDQLSKKNQIMPTNTATQLTFGFYVNWDDASFTSLKENIQKLTW